jgi:hypothetical protein
LLLGASRQGKRQQRNGEYGNAHGTILAKTMSSDARFENAAIDWPLPSPLLKISELPFETKEVGK